MQRLITNDVPVLAQQLYDQVKEKKQGNDALLLSALEKIAKSEKISPDDWAFFHETLNKDHPCMQFFNQYRNDISKQFMLQGRKYTAVPIIRFTSKGEQYVLLLKNLGLKVSSNVQEVQWTAHGVRVDSQEKELLQTPSAWDLYKKLSSHDDPLTYLLAAAIRRINEIGIKITEKDICNIHFIDRRAAGFPEMSTDYCTEYFDVDLGERDLDALIDACTSSVSRFGQWTHAFKLSELKATVKEDKVLSGNQTYILTYKNEPLPIRPTTWCFLRALQVLTDREIKSDGNKDPWQLRNLTPFETAIRWVKQRMDNAVQFTLFSEENNRLSSAQAHAYAAKAKMNEENLAFTSMKPERLVLLVVIAYLTVNVKINNSDELEKMATQLFRKFFELSPNSKVQWEDEFKKMQLELNQKVHTNPANASRISELHKTISSTELSENHKTIYHMRESDLQIATAVRLHEKFHDWVMSDIRIKVNKLVEIAIKEDKYVPLERYALSDRNCFGITGPVASGKSVSEKMIRAMLGKTSTAFIGSDEWNKILSDYLHLDQAGFVMQRGKLTLPEAWFVKVIIWDLLAEMEKSGHAPNWIQEACDPSTIKSINSGKNVIFVNTADPCGAASRIKERGDKSGRYVSASAAIGSYRWPWLNFLKTLESIKDNVSIKVIDTDVMFAKTPANETKRTEQATIATVNNMELEIHNLNRFLIFMARSFRVNPFPKHPGEILQAKPNDSLILIIKEIEKLYSTNPKIRIKYKGNVLSKDNFLKLANQLYVSGIRPLERARQIMLFKKTSAGLNKPQQINLRINAVT